jgi:hypothetical protein
MRIHGALATTLLFGLSACAATMMEDRDRMRSLLDDARAEGSLHLSVTQTTTTMPAMRSEMDRHTSVMSGMMEDIDATMTSMEARCHGNGLSDMRMMDEALGGEMAQHSSTMPSILDLAAARAEVERHVQAMASMMNGMDGATGRMSCPM